MANGTDNVDDGSEKKEIYKIIDLSFLDRTASNTRCADPATSNRTLLINFYALQIRLEAGLGFHI